MYDCPALGVEGYSYWLFKTGRVVVVSPELMVDFGSYERRREGWVWINQAGESYALHPGIRSLGVMDSNGVSADTAPFQRLFFPPEWLRRK